ncbi:hypothetical protein MBM_08002 [Drepanopeziza brunnea f. sp. 'multigermtubi' MB_m1]|uniref:Uncharacterized protein n=1 Tax=Marssonina brunnea f. sp. multigermtubi (strain MB_m1) TaxID=1072389 RepID=K1WLQ1_MARBU|nr:uncharacterized protein MBM_08002 [Drepanopeziza brunnea f. sp. 'multigermtubi' MB_m1]EKD13801.1 hypothetical protein MBM_08002 [Drepanopeziza brunnea f. sp. 'multigermtubi' MB_m1]
MISTSKSAALPKSAQSMLNKAIEKAAKEEAKKARIAKKAEKDEAKRLAILNPLLLKKRSRLRKEKSIAKLVLKQLRTIKKEKNQVEESQVEIALS